MPSVFSIPHEGITVELLARPIPHILLQPLFTAPLLALNLYRPLEIVKHLPPQIQEYLFHPTANVILSGLVIAGLIFRINKFLSRMSLNNWTSDRTWNVSKEIVLVTGGNSGIGKRLVEQLSAKGYKVASVDISDPKETLPVNVKFYKADVTNSQAIKAAADKIRSELGEVTVLVNNAGVGHAKDILKETENEIRLTVNVNLLSHFLMFREFAPAMIKKNHGHIITVASMASFLCQASNVDYASTKAGVLAFHEGIQQELRYRYNAPAVRTSVIHPIWVKTALTAPLYESGRWKELTIEQDTVADAITEQIQKGEAAQILLPNRLNVVCAIRGWPSWLAVGVRNAHQDKLVGFHEEAEALAAANKKA